MNIDLSSFVEELQYKNSLSEADVLRLRRDIFPDGLVDRHEVAAVIKLNQTVKDKHTSFLDFFIEAIVDFAASSESENAERVTEAEADWLMSCLAPDGIIQTPIELEALVRIMERTHDVPEQLAAFALEQVKFGVISGSGPTTAGRHHNVGVVDEADVQLLRRMMFAMGSDGGLYITRAEANVLFDIHDATAGGENAPEFEDMFVKAIANHVLSACNQHIVHRNDAILENSMAPESRSVGRFLSEIKDAGAKGLVSGGMSEILQLIKSPSIVMEESYASRNQEQDELNRSALLITEEEANWLAKSIMRDGKPTAAELALLKFIFNETGTENNKLVDILEKAS